MAALDEAAQQAAERAEALGDENVKVSGRLKRAMAERDALRRKLVELQEASQQGEQTLIKSFDELKKSRVEDEARYKETIEKLQAERTALREKYAELRRKAEAIKRRSDGLSAAANEQISQATEAQKSLQEKLRAAMEEHAQARGRAKAQIEQLQAQLAEAQSSGAAEAENQLANLKARLAQQEERVARLTTEIAAERERRKKVIAKAREYEAQLAARGDDDKSAADEWKARFAEERKRSDGYKQKYQGLGKDYKELLERHQTLVAKVKKARAAKEKPPS